MNDRKDKSSPCRSILRVVGIALIVLVLAVVWLFGWLTVGEYKPEAEEPVEVGGAASQLVYPGSTISVLTWNMGYGALGDNADFFMDGGSGVRTADEDRVRENVQTVIDEIEALAPDVVFLQEVDRDSARSWRIDEADWIAKSFGAYQNTFAYNYRVMFVPYPVPPIGKVNSGLLTLSSYPVSSSVRVQLPCPFSWPLRLGNLKRCLMIDRVPINGSDKELVLVNLHLEAYDDGEGKIAQTEILREVLQREADAGNYVIAGGDFNQIFSSVVNPYPSREGMWLPGEIDVSAFEDGWQFLMDTTRPSCRSLDRPLAGSDTSDFQYYLIDGFIVSSGVEVISVQTQDLGFVNSDHNPVLVQVRLPYVY